MPFIPHTEKDVADMLQTIGEQEVSKACSTRFPAELRIPGLDRIGPALSEAEISRLHAAARAR